MFCPNCGSEYRPEFKTCADCEVALVNELPNGWEHPKKWSRSHWKRTEEPIASIKEPSINYIKKHWIGQLSLSVSFWINLFLLNIAIRIILTFLDQGQNAIIEHPQIAARTYLASLTISLLLVYPWQFVGVWRSCNRHIKETSRVFWARATQVVVVLGLISTIGLTNQYWPIYRDLYDLGFENDQYADYSLKLEKENTVIHLTGNLGFGVSDDVADLLYRYPNVSAIILDSPGGRIYEGRELAKLILKNGLETYSFKSCYSACTTAFIAGKKRYLTLDANLAFHQYQTPYESFDSSFDMSTEQEKDLILFQQQGISKEFLDRMFSTASNDFWYPSFDELIDANVVHKVVKASDILTSPTQYQISSSEIEDAFLDIPAFKTIKKYDPKTFQEIIEEINSQLTKGATITDVQHSVAGYIEVIAERVLPQTSDNALIQFIKAIIDSVKLLKQKDPILCLKSLYPEQYGPINFSTQLSNEQKILMLDALNGVIVDGYEKENPSIDLESAENTIYHIVSAMGDEANYIEPLELQDREDYRRACDAAIMFYELIIAEEENTCGNALRYLLSQE